MPASDFIKGHDPVTALGNANKITFLTDEEKQYGFFFIIYLRVLKSSRWLALDVTTADVKANCDDLKVLGKGDFKTLIKWRLALREEVYDSFQAYQMLTNYAR